MAQRRYSANGGAAVGTNLSLATLIGGTGVRPTLYDFTIGCAATPADQATKFGLQRVTTAGTAGSSFTPVALDNAEIAATCTVGQGVFGVEPTYTANSTLLLIDMNQRATYRFVCDESKGFVVPATANNGLGFRSISATGSATHDASFTWVE